MSFGRLYRALRGLPKTVFFNFRYFPIATAIRLPVWVSHQVWLKQTGGAVALDVEPPALRSGLVRIGFNDVGIFDRRSSRAIWEVSGQVVFRGAANIGHGSKLSVSGTLVLGDRFTVTAESAIVCRTRIEFGAGCLLSWDVLVMDSDFHAIFDANDERINDDEPVSVGDGVWMGCRTLVLKGVTIENGCVIGANTTLSRSIDGEKKLIAGNPARVVRDDVQWKS